MAQITITIPTQYVDRVVVALNRKYRELKPFDTEIDKLTELQIIKKTIQVWLFDTIKSMEYQTEMDDITINVPDEVIEVT